MTDEQLLTALHRRDHGRESVTSIAASFGMSRSGLSAALGRVDKAAQPCACTKPENKDGGMAPLWWRHDE